MLGKGLSPQDFLALLRATVGIGLGALSSSLLRTAGAPLLADPSIAALLGQLERLPTGEIPKADQARFLEGNLKAIRRARSLGIHELGDWSLDPATILADARVAPSRDALGRVALTARAEPSVAEPRPPLRLLAPLRLRLPAAWIEAFAKLWPPFASMSGLPSPHLMSDLLGRKREGHLPAKIVVFETDELVFRTWLRSHDLSGELASGAIELRCGPRGAESHLEAIRASLATPPSPCVLIVRDEPLLSQGMKSFADASARTWAERRREADAAARVRIGEFTLERRRTRMRDALGGRRGGATRLVIAGSVSRHTAVVCHMMRDLLDAFRSLGHETILITEPTPSSPMVDLLGPLAERDVDLLVTINYLRAHPAPLTPAPLPFVCWMQDLIVSAQTREAAASQGPMDLLVSQSAGFFSHRFGYRGDQSISAPNLTSWAMYGSIGETKREPGAPDVVYIGHGWEDASELVVRQGAGSQALAVLTQAHRVLNERLGRGETITGFDRMRAIAEIVGAPLRPGAGNGLYWAVQTVYDRLFRHQALTWAARWCEARGKSFAIYGSGWENHPTLGRHARGTIENGVPLGKLCRDAGVVLHANGNASLHQRLLDGLAAGGCVLTRYNPADFVPRAWRVIRERASGANHAGLLARAASDPTLASAIAEFERTLGCSLAASGTPARDRDRQVIERIDFWPPETLTDDGLAEHLTNDTGFLTPHGAADLEGFEQGVYRSEAELGALLERALSSDAERDSLRLAPRAGVRARFTMEWLARSILDRMGEMLERTA